MSVMTISGHGLSEDLGLLRSGVGGDGREKRLLQLERPSGGHVAVAKWFGVDAFFWHLLKQPKTGSRR